jgi:sarcosine oxidase
MYDVVVLGLGGMGSAALARIAMRGKRVLGIEQFAEAHEFGSSAGRSRIIRKAYFEDPAYVPLLERAYELWREIERLSDTKLLDLVGLLLVGRPTSTTIAGARASAALHGLALEDLTRDDILARYPTLNVLEDEAGVFERDAGMVFPEKAIAAHLAVARAAGAETRFSTAVRSYESTPFRSYASTSQCIRLTLDDGSTIDAARLAICAGPWLGEIARDLHLPLRVQRNVQVWFEPRTPAYGIDRFPAFLIERDGWPVPLYGFPDYGYGVKAALHAYGDITTPEALDRNIRDADIERVASALDAWMPGAAGRFLAGKACMYTLTPDEHFIIDLHPSDSRIVIAGGFSGHGYKFCSVVGEAIADLALDGGTSLPIDFLAIDRPVLAHRYRKS